jgi:hypothetical protein
MAAPRRWLQFSMRRFLLLLTVGCLLPGWRVERAHKRGQAIDAIVEAGGEVRFGRICPPPNYRPDHFWLDLQSVPVHIYLREPVDADLGRSLSQINELYILEIASAVSDISLRYLEDARVVGEITFWRPDALSDAALDRLRHKWPNTLIAVRSKTGGRRYIHFPNKLRKPA